MAAKYVRPYSKGQKNDFRDAEAIAEAVQRPTMKFIAIKSIEQLDLQALHRVRERLARLGPEHYRWSGSLQPMTGYLPDPNPRRLAGTIKGLAGSDALCHGRRVPVNTAAVSNETAAI
jgi:transposase